MKEGIHPLYHPRAQVHCACGHTWTTGSATANLEVEICSHCHPFYSGKEKILDASGRVDKFKRRQEKTLKKSRIPKTKVKLSE